MTEASKLKEEAKKNLRSLLQSAQGGRTLHELRCDFRDFFFSELPGKEFGYNSPEDFLKDIPDVVVITYSGGNMIFKAVASASTAHIQRLVSLNKSSKKKSSSARSRNVPLWSAPPPFTKSGNPMLAPRFQKVYAKQCFQNGGQHNARVNQPVSTSRSGYNSHAHHNRPASVRLQARHRTVPIIPAFIQGQIHQLLDSNPHGLPLTHFCRVFKLRFKVPIEPQQMGFPDEHEMLASVPNIAMLKRFPQGEVRVMLAKPSLAQSLLHGHKVTEDCWDQREMNHNAQPQSFNKKNSVKDSSETDVPRPQPPQPKDNWEDLFTNHSCNIPSHVQDKMSKLIEKRPQGIYASHLASAYKDQFNEMLQIKSYGYNSVIDFVSDLSHIVVIERPKPQGDWLLYPVNSKPDPQVVKENQSESICTFLPVENEVKESLCQVLCAHPSGVLLDRFLQTYKEMTGTILEVENYGKGTLKQFLHTLSDVLNIVLDVSDNLKVCAKFQQGPRRFDKLLDNYRPTTVAQGTSLELDLDLPADVVTPGCYYRPLLFPQWKESTENYVEVYVSFVINPSCFWVQLRGERTTLALEELMDDLEKHYKGRPSRKYHMPPSLAKEGTLCVAIYPEDGFWYRAIILGFENPLYKIYYVDYGNTCTVTIDNIRLLKSRFLKLPAQAIKARLSNIQPLAQKWSIRARDKMLELCREIPLIALVAGMKDRTLSLCLTDTRGQDDVHINDMLVMEKYARFAPDHDGSDSAQTPGQGPSCQMLFGGEGRSSDSDGNASSGPVRRYIRQAQINDNLILNLINLCGKGLYLISAEISSLFFKEDIISSMLIKDNAKIQKVVVAKTNYPDLFSELIQYETAWVTESTTRLGLYPLAGLPLIIDLYGQGQDLDNLKDTVLEILDWFTPDDPYWRGEDDVATVSDETDPHQDSQSVVSDSSEPITLEDLVQALNILQMKRKQVLRKIMSNEGNVDELVNELNGYELSIKRVEDRKSKQENQEVVEKKKALDSAGSSSRAMDEISSASTSKMSGASQSITSSLSSLSLPPTQDSRVPTSLTSAASTVASVPANANAVAESLPCMTPQQQQNFLLNSMYMSSLGLLPNLSQSALHGLSPAAMNKNVSDVSQLPGFLPQPSLGQGLAAMPTTSGQLGNLGLLTNQNLAAPMPPGVGRGFVLPQCPALTMSQMTAINQAMLAANPQIYNSQLLSMPRCVVPQTGDLGANPSPSTQMPSLSLAGMPHTATTAQSLLQQQHFSSQIKKS